MFERRGRKFTNLAALEPLIWHSLGLLQDQNQEYKQKLGNLKYVSG